MLQNVLFASVLLVATVAANQAITCPEFSDAVDPFGLAMPTSNCTAVTNCTMAYCSCNGGGATVGDSGEVQCTLGTAGSCNFLTYCAQTYFWCLASTGGDDTCGDWSTQMKDGLLEILTEPAKLNQSLLYRSCAHAACDSISITKSECLESFNAADICFPVQATLIPLSNPRGGFTFLPRLPAGGFAVPVVKIVASLKFHGNFTPVFDQGNTSAKAAGLRTSLETVLTRLLRYPVSIVAMFVGSLIAQLEVVIPQSDMATSNTVYDNIGFLSSLSPSAFRDVLVSCRASGGCARGMSAPDVSGLVRILAMANGTFAPTDAPLTRVPRLPGGVFAFPVFVISADLTFGGDFTLTFNDGNTSSRAKTMSNTLFVALTNFLDYPVDIMSMWGGITGLKTHMEAVIPQSNGAKADDVFNRLNAKVASRLFGAQDTLDFSQLSVANLRKRLAGAAGKAEPRCETRCIAFIVIGIVVVVIVIIAAFLCTKKSNEVHGEKA